MALTEKTLIPLGAAIISIGGGAWWLSDVHSELVYQKQTSAEMSQQIKEINDAVGQLRSDMREVKTMLKDRENALLNGSTDEDLDSEFVSRFPRPTDPESQRRI